MVEPLYVEEDYLDEVEELEGVEEDDLDDEEAEELEGLAEQLAEEDDDDDEAAERRRRRRRRRRSRGWRRRPSPRVGWAKGLYRRPPSKNLVSQGQLRNALRRVRANIRRNGVAIRKVNRRINSLGRRVNSQVRVNSRQGRNIAALRRDLDGWRQTSLLMSLFAGTKRYRVESIGAGFVQGSEIKLKEKSEPIEMLMPMLLSPGGSGKPAAGGGLSLDNPLMLMLMMKMFENDD